MWWVPGFTSFTHLVVESRSRTGSFPGINWQIPIQFSGGVDLSQIHGFLSQLSTET